MNRSIEPNEYILYLTAKVINIHSIECYCGRAHFTLLSSMNIYLLNCQYSFFSCAKWQKRIVIYRVVPLSIGLSVFYKCVNSVLGCGLRNRKKRRKKVRRSRKYNSCHHFNLSIIAIVQRYKIDE